MSDRFDNVLNFSGESFVGEGRPRPVDKKPAPALKCMCEGCGAPLQLTEARCSYCLRATGYAGPTGVLNTRAGILSPAQARALWQDWERRYSATRLGSIAVLGE